MHEFLENVNLKLSKANIHINYSVKYNIIIKKNTIKQIYLKDFYNIKVVIFSRIQNIFEIQPFYWKVKRNLSF